MQKARRHTLKSAPTACRRMVSGTISLFSWKCFSPFPHGTGSLSVSREYLALPDGPGGFAQNFTCSALLRIPLGRIMLRVQVCHLLWMIFPNHSARNQRTTAWSYYPGTAVTAPVWAGPRSLATTRGIIVYFLFLEVLRCFSSLRSPPYSCMDDRPSDGRVVPFGNPRVKGYLLLTAAYRSLSRPSSPP